MVENIEEQVGRQLPAVVRTPNRSGGDIQHRQTHGQHRIALRAVAAAAEIRSEAARVDYPVRPRVGSGVLEHKRVGVRQLGPENKADAERVCFGFFHHAFDESVVVADLRVRLIGLKDTENPRKAAYYIPVEHRILGLRIGGIIKQENLLFVQLVQQAANFVIGIGKVQIPRSQQQLASGIVFPDIPADTTVNVQLQPQIGLTVLGIGALGQADGMKQPCLPVIPNVRGGEREIVIQIRVVGNVPDQPGLLAVDAAVLRKQPGLLGTQEVQRCAGVPVRHRAAVLGVHQVALEGVGQHPFAQHASVLERPEERAVVKPLPRLGKPVHGGGIGNAVGERLLEQVVQPQPQHKQVHPLFQQPVNFTLPIPRSPHFGLKPVQRAMCKLPCAAVRKARRLGERHALPHDVRALRHGVAVPEI